MTKGNKTALHLTVTRDSSNTLEIVRFLVESGLDPLSKTGNDQVAVELAKLEDVKEFLTTYSGRRKRAKLGDGEDSNDAEDKTNEAKEETEVSEREGSDGIVETSAAPEQNTSESILGKRQRD